METKLGAHVSIAGGYKKALERIIEMGGNCLQIFSTSPRGWSMAALNKTDAAEFVETKHKLKVDPVYFHALYLINLANTGRTGQRSVESLVHELTIAPQLEIRGTIVHLGSYKLDKKEYAVEEIPPERYSLLLNNIQTVLDSTPAETLFIIEDAGNRKIGRSLDEITQIVKDLNNPRVQVCLDTCHLHAAGYDLSTQDKLQKFLAEFDQAIGLEKLELWHLNDSRDPFGSLRDRHENIGQGQIGPDVFRLLLNHPQTKHLPFIIETPGFHDKGPDQQNLDILKGLATEEPGSS